MPRKSPRRPAAPRPTPSWTETLPAAYRLPAAPALSEAEYAALSAQDALERAAVAAAEQAHEAGASEDEIARAAVEAAESEREREALLATRTRFAKGERVCAALNAQGMIQGAVYEVREVEVRATPFGEFVTYILADGATLFPVRNAHLLCWKV
jgi:hypothetical protein